MTRDDFPPFKAGMERTGAAYGKALPLDLVSTYYGDLEAYPLAAVLAALDKARQTGKFFPRVSTLRELCQSNNAVKVGTVVPSWIDHNADVYFCTSCRDTGYVRDLDCAGDGRCHIGHCGHPGYANVPHEYTRKCTCRAENPILVRQRELIAERTAHQDAS